MDLPVHRGRSLFVKVCTREHLRKGSTVLIPSAEESYNKGLRVLSIGRLREAMALFEAAIEIERRRGVGSVQPRYLSYYGLCLAIERNEIREALQYCREALTLESFNSDIRCNLGRVLLRAGRRREAYNCFRRSLSLETGHTATLRALKVMGLRRRPVVPFLARANPLNVLLGRLRKAG
jgi:tetratricopeptide (TPR) repeat protein